MTNTKLKILHLSDIHERGGREKDRFRRHRVLLNDAWKRNVDEVVSEGAIDLVCITGDLADWGKKEEYEALTPWLDALLRRLDLPRERLFLVPGNHDIDRKTNKAAWKALRKLVQRVPASAWSDWLADGKLPLGPKAAHRDLVLERSAAYRAWVGDDLGRKRLLPGNSAHGRLGYCETLAIPNKPPIHVIGLDSAWMCGDDNDKGKLLLTADQVGRLTSDKTGAPLVGFRLGLVHHPLTDLADVSECRDRLAGGIDLLLRGHLHEEELSTWSDPQQTLRQFAAGSLYGDDKDRSINSFHVIDAVINDGGQPQRCDVRMRAWSPQGPGYWHDHGGAYRETIAGRLTVWFTAPPPAFAERAATLAPQLIGREAELKGLRELFEQGTRLVTISGMGGLGKTSLARKFVEIWCKEHPGQPTLFVELDEASEVSIMPGLVAAQLMNPARDGIVALQREGQPEDIGTTLARIGPCLLVLDSAEHLIDKDEAKTAIRAWLDSAQELRILMTSQIEFVPEGARLYPLGTLELPRSGRLEASKATQLFLDRVDIPNFLPSPDQRRAIDGLVRILEGIPLAIVLAASRFSDSGVQGITEGLSRNLESLARPARSAARHKHDTMTATLAWSCGLLKEDQRRALACCAVFHGEFSDEAAGVVLKADPVSTKHWMDALSEVSLLRRVQNEKGLLPRRAMFEVVRLFVKGEPTQSHAVIDALARHATYYCGRYQQVAEEFEVTRRRDVIREIADDLRNVVAAVETILVPERRWSDTDLSNALRTILALDATYSINGPLHAHLPLLDRAITSARVWNVDAALKARVLMARARVRHLRKLDDKGSLADLEEAYRLVPDSDHQLKATVVAELGAHFHRLRGRQRRGTALVTAEKYYLEGLAVHKQRDQIRARLLGNMGALRHDQLRFDDARLFYEKALKIVRIANPGQRAHHLMNLGILEHEVSNLSSAKNQQLLALELLKESGYRRLLGLVHGNLGLVYHEQHRFADARACYDEAISVLHGIGDLRLEAITECRWAALAALQGEIGAAEEALNRASAFFLEKKNDDGTERAVLVELGRAFIEFARARSAALNAHRDDVDMHLMAVREVLAHLRASSPSPHDLWHDVRLLHRILEQSLVALDKDPGGR